MRVLFRVAAALLIAAPAFLVLVIVFLLAARRRAPPRGSPISRSFERGVSVGPFSSCE